MNEYKYHYLYTKLDIDAFDLDDFKYNFVNITAFRLVDVDNIGVREVIKEMNRFEQRQIQQHQQKHQENNQQSHQADQSQYNKQINYSKFIGVIYSLTPHFIIIVMVVFQFFEFLILICVTQF